MTDPIPKLTSHSIAILEMIAAGNSYEQILAEHLDLTYWDIFRAADEALKALSPPPNIRQPTSTLAQQRERHPRAYEAWTAAEDDQLRHLVTTGETVARIAGTLQRNRGAIRSRIMKLNLVSQLPRADQTRLRRMAEHDETTSS